MARPDAGTTPAYARWPAWLVVLGGVSAALHAGKLPAALPALQQATGMDLRQGVWLLSLFQLATLLGGLALSLLVARIGLRRAMVAGLFLLSLGSLAGSFGDGVGALLAARGVESLGLLAVAVSGPALVRALCAGPRQGFMLAAWGMFMPAGFALGLLLAPVLLAHAGWPQLWQGCALVSALCAALLAWRLPDARARASATQRSTALALADRVLRRPHTTGLGLLFALYAGLWLTLVGLLPTLLVGQGMALPLAATAAALVVASNAAGNLGAGWLAARGWSPRARLLLGFGVLLGGMPLALLALSQPDALRIVAALLASALGGLVPGTLFQLLPRAAPDADAVPATTGWMLQCSAAGQLVLPWLLVPLLGG